MIDELLQYYCLSYQAEVTRLILLLNRWPFNCGHLSISKKQKLNFYICVVLGQILNKYLCNESESRVRIDHCSC